MTLIKSAHIQPSDIRYQVQFSLQPVTSTTDPLGTVRTTGKPTLDPARTLAFVSTSAGQVAGVAVATSTGVGWLIGGLATVAGMCIHSSSSAINASEKTITRPNTQIPIQEESLFGWYR